MVVCQVGKKNPRQGQKWKSIRGGNELFFKAKHTQDEGLTLGLAIIAIILTS